MGKAVKIGSVKIGAGGPLALIAGPCVIESRKACVDLARRLADLAGEAKIPLVFKASYDKANRSSVGSYRGPGMVRGLAILEEVKDKTGLPVLADVHSEAEVVPVSRVVDALQIPAFLCRQTDLLVAAGESGAVVNIKKGQFLAPWDMEHVIAKVESTGNRKILVTERGTSFGYNNLVADMRSLLVLREKGYPVVFDATHSVQRPGAGGDRSGGDGKWASALARAAVATGCDAVFVETHVSPSKALCDGPNCIQLSNLKRVWTLLVKIHKIAGS